MDTIMTKPIGHKVIVVYHSLPLSLRKLKLGVWSFHDRNLYSLVSSLTSLKDQKVIEKHCWVGCPTTKDKKLVSSENEQATEALNIQLAENSCIPVETVSSKLYDDAVNKFSQQFLNPLFHYDISDSTFQDSHWKSYKLFNKRFASKIAEIYQPGDIVWIHGIQLLLVPKYLRELINSCLIGFFLYCPFPAVEIYRCLASRKKILQGILGSDLVAFQSYSYSRYFIQSCTRILGVAGGFDGVKYRQERIGKEHLTRVSVYPEGIDPLETQRSLAFQETQQRLAELKARFKDLKIFLAK
ncbi:glycosyl transferase [Heterostelium album PN500]|uniref:Glycosyl transferase n=1 Tax=Heterostelium pallidum (strain ATCC 26659 / Pp 5 / PN500) TaxID=670386 RepID=D3BJQ8_HETP5|nr:glycosyl transferase [Heterostelium album PN500]EFA78138.1 glycosyl transferase [Heterostelium album PN500]|eukprot:XP_020430264.1 glycosyl transferase [Heterostelium album PN500]